MPSERGRYLAIAGNCVSCHTRQGGKPFAGGVAFETPLGTIYSTNITADRKTGIGDWSVEEFRRAMHEGIARDGRRLFPAFPYTAFTRLNSEDVDAIYAYLREVKPVAYSPPRNDTMFRLRWGMRAWNAMFFTPGRFKHDAKQSVEWNRGAYLVEGLGHCGSCHTPRNRFMAEIGDRAYAGGVFKEKVVEGKVRTWSGVNLTSSKSGLATWSVDELTRYLSTGVSKRAGTFGPMNEVIVNSLQYLTQEDVRAMAVYLKTLPPQHSTARPVQTAQINEGGPIYKERCEKCHMSSGRGGMFAGPPLAGSAIVQADNPASLINVILHGPQTPDGMKFGRWETMKAYGDVLSDEQVAAVSNYVRGSWGNSAPAVSEADVATQR